MPEEQSPERYASELCSDTTVSNTGNKRVINNVMRHEYRILSEAEKAQMQNIKDRGLAMYMMFDAIGGSRELSLAKTKIEEAVMWAVKHTTR